MAIKKETIEIQEILKKPWNEEQVVEFKVGEHSPISLYGERAMEEFNEFSEMAHKMQQSEPLVVFWGLSGKLADYYSKIDPSITSADSVNAKIQFANTQQPFSVFRQSNFEVTIEQMGGIASFREVGFQEAILMLEGKKAFPQPAYIEPEEEDEDVFDDDCTDECRPGDHKCGK